MVADRALPLIKAVIATLKADAALSALVSGRVYTDVPQASNFPYIVVTAGDEPFAANDFSGQSFTLRVQAFSRQHTIYDVLAIRSAVFSALDRREDNLALSAGTLVKCEYSGSERPFIEDNGKTWQVVSEFNIIVV
ncbi:MAG: DUF3168 domain-containing protein [Aquamicrobium sp.]|nr:DUF3168 domain-containing protein [Aquamicrobium sp.]